LRIGAALGRIDVRTVARGAGRELTALNAARCGIAIGLHGTCMKPPRLRRRVADRTMPVAAALRFWPPLRMETRMNISRADAAQRRRTFRQLHESGCFVIPNPWDRGSAMWLQALGFKALATTSSGFAWSQGRADGALGRDRVLAHLRDIVAATDLPVNADFESGFGADPDEVAESVRLAVDTGVAGVSIEDSTGDSVHPQRALGVAVARLHAARQAIDASGGDTLLVGRAENFLFPNPDLADTIRRLQAYAEAGADCLYAPGIRTREQIGAVVAAVAPKPVNLLVGWPSESTLADFAALGVRRVSVGGALARAAWRAFMRAAREIAEHGRFDAFAEAARGDELNGFFGRR
jgi:2-methylisocitrate lyase-like PEP mutase family enzyme